VNDFKIVSGILGFIHSLNQSLTIDIGRDCFGVEFKVSLENFLLH